MAPEELYNRVFDDFDNFLSPTSAEPDLYRAVARRAVKQEVKLSIDRIARIANHAPDQDTVVPLLAAHQGLDGGKMVEILVKLGEPYSLLQTAGAEADVPEGNSAATVFNRLDATGVVKLVQRRRRFQVR
nr:hypothetical protein [Pseudonocardia alni]